MRVIATAGYERRVRRLLGAEMRAAAEAAIVARPDAWAQHVLAVVEGRVVELRRA